MQIEEKCCEYNLNKNNDTKISNDNDDFPMSLLKSVHDVIKKEEYANYTVQKRSISTIGGNYLSILYEVDINGRTAREEKETNIFIKYMIPNEQKIFSITDAYLKERFAYSDLSKVITEIQEKANVPDEERYKMVKCYPSGPEAIMLDNLNRKGFTTPFRMDPISLRFAELAIEQLAKFHGLSFVLKELRPDYFNKNLKTLEQPFIFSENWETFYKNMFDLMSSNLNEARKKKLEAVLPRFVKTMPKYLSDTESAGCVVCHGDFRPNNILMKKSDGEIMEIIPVDYQILYYGCPINDLLYFIITGTDRKLRKEHMNDLKNLYYDCLKKFVSYFDLNIETLYPREEFERQYKERLDYGLMLSVYVLPFIYASEDYVPDLGNEDLSTLEFVLDERYKERINGVIDDYEEWGLL